VKLYHLKFIVSVLKKSEKSRY